MERIVVLDYGMGNLRSVAKALERVAAPRQRIEVSGERGALERAARVVFPGQGAIRDCMAELERRGLVEPLLEALAVKPFLGICLGLQALMETSEEDAATAGLGVIAGAVRRFPRDAGGGRLKIPHMGWNNVYPAVAHPLLAGIEPGERFYFVHSYYVEPRDASAVTARTTYGIEFACAVAKDNLFAVQFHPEKSQRAGLKVLENFLVRDS